MSAISSPHDDSPMKHLYAIIRKPQEGKTFICLENIHTTPTCCHLIITMNTIKSNLQFFERAKARFGEKICVFNSREKKKDQNPDFLHAKDITGVKKHLVNGTEVVIMCAHPKRFDVSIGDLLSEISADMRLQKKVVIHIDEAHAYVPAYRHQIVEMNDEEVTERIYMYSATPFAIWVQEASVMDGDQLFKEIFVVDCEKNFGTKKSDLYFGVKDCKVKVMMKLQPFLNPMIDDNFILSYGSEKQRKNVQSGGKEFWYGTNSKSPPFSIGDEVELLMHTINTLSEMKGRRIHDDKFSYNFVPGFCRKLTHYAIMDLILKFYPTALVIIINGDGSRLYRIDECDGNTVGEYMYQKNEPSEQIEECMRRFPHRPVFITGFHCVGMSVTFINKTIGNFDNVVFSHEHYIKNPDILYQLCRFLFNYISWDESSRTKIKKTQIFVTSQNIIDQCLDYEIQIDKITESMTDSLRTKCEVQGDIKIKEKKLPKESAYDGLIPYSNVEIKKVTVDDEDEAEKGLEKVKKIYKEWTGKELKGKAMPTKNEDGFYECSTTGGKGVITDPKKMKKTLISLKPTSNFDPKQTKYNYARVYIAYEDEEDPSEYTWFIRKMKIERCEEVSEFWRQKNQ